MASATAISLRTWALASDSQVRSPTQTVVRSSCWRGIWEGKISHDHPELEGHLDEVLRTVATPDHVVEPDPRADRRRYYRRNVGPSSWLMVVVSFEQVPGRIITALALRKDPKRWQQ